MRPYLGEVARQRFRFSVVIPLLAVLILAFVTWQYMIVPSYYTMSGDRYRHQQATRLAMAVLSVTPSPTYLDPAWIPLENFTFTPTPTITFTPTFTPTPTTTFIPIPTFTTTPLPVGLSVLPSVLPTSPAGYVSAGYGSVPVDLSRYPGGKYYANMADFPGEFMRGRISYYWPPYGGINCDHECNFMADGSYWADWIGRAAACPEEYPFGTQIVVFGHTWICRDRGGAIVRVAENLVWIDLLTPVMPYGLVWGQEVDIVVIRSD